MMVFGGLWLFAKRFGRFVVVLLLWLVVVWLLDLFTLFGLVLWLYECLGFRCGCGDLAWCLCLGGYYVCGWLCWGGVWW